MGLLAYCIVSRAGRMPRLPREISGRAVRLLQAQDLGAAVSQVTEPPPARAEEIMAFNSVVEWFHQRFHSLLPIRFGCVLASEAQVTKVLQANADHYRELLRELDGTCEIGMRLLPDSPPGRKQRSKSASSEASGTAWLKARREYYRRREQSQADLQRIEAEVKSKFADMFVRASSETNLHMHSMYFLVPRRKADAFLKRASQVRLPGAKVLVTGPWPPYNFVNVSADTVERD